MKKLFLICIAFSLSACNVPEYQNDPDLRRIIFKECLELIPPGPVHTKYNDWDEVVEACGGEAYYQSRVCIKNCLKGKE